MTPKKTVSTFQYNPTRSTKLQKENEKELTIAKFSLKTTKILVWEIPKIALESYIKQHEKRKGKRYLYKKPKDEK